MLRLIAGIAQHADEDWVQYIIRPTHASEETAERFGAECWISGQRRAKLRFAGSTVRSDDGRWSQQLMHWRPELLDGSFRDVGRPLKRWKQDLCEYAGDGWREHAMDAALWAALEQGFVEQL